LTKANSIISPYALPSPDARFEEQYITARRRENRMYSDTEVSRLPRIPKSHMHAAEWKIRSRSSKRLVHYLENKHVPLNLLEVGCGNGWLSNRLSEMKYSTVTGIDISKTEIIQAQRVFPEKSNLQFAAGDMQSISYAMKFDVLVFAASVQYFFPLEELIEDALLRLKENGEIHILDSYFYCPADRESARHRSRIYYQSIGQEEMADFYFHHSAESLKRFHCKYLYNPKDFRNKILGRKDPFPWIRIQRP